MNMQGKYGKLFMGSMVSLLMTMPLSAQQVFEGTSTVTPAYEGQTSAPLAPKSAKYIVSDLGLCQYIFYSWKKNMKLSKKRYYIIASCAIILLFALKFAFEKGELFGISLAR